MASKSDVWASFVKVDGGGRCKICQVVLKTSGNTSNMRQHLNRKHPLTTNPEKSNQLIRPALVSVLHVPIFSLYI